MTILPAFLIFYFLWAPRQILKIWQSFLIFFWHFFSIGVLTKTLFSPFRREILEFGEGFSFTKLFEWASYNLISRAFGAVVRLIVITTGMVVEVGVLILGGVSFLLWWFLPFILVLGIWKGIELIL